MLWTQSFVCMLLAKMKEGILGPFVIFARHGILYCETSKVRHMEIVYISAVAYYQFCNAKPLSVLVFSYITITTWAYSRDLQVIQMTVLKPTKTENLGKFKSYCTLFNLYKANTIIVVKDNRLEMH